MKQFLFILSTFFAFHFSFGQSSEINHEVFSDEYREFDFWIGEWNVNLRKPTENSKYIDWKDSKAKIYSILDGRAVLELWEEKGNAGPESVIIGYSLRYYSPDKNKWSLWLNWPGINRSGSRNLTGKFRHGRGEFFRQDRINDSISNITRYTFSDITTESLRWDSATSMTNGKDWISGWIMEFSRVNNKANWPESDRLHTFRNGNRCILEEFGELEEFVGKWEGQVKMKSTRGTWSEMNISISNYRALGGCSVMSFLEVEGDDSHNSFKEFGLLTFNTYANKFEDGRLSNDPKSSYRPLFGEKKDGYLQLSRRNRKTGKVIERYKWQVKENKLLFEKWELLSEETEKVMEGRLKIN